MRLRTGTSGFAYKEWKGSFYPEESRAEDFLRLYAERLEAVEVNNTFYRVPSARVLSSWLDQVPPDFTFVLKAPMRITHRARLKDVAADLEYFLRVSGTLGSRLGPILVQLPPNLRKDVPRLDAFLEQVPAGTRVALEFRHPSWLDEEVYAALANRDAALCLADADPEESEIVPPDVATASFGYLRLRRSAYDEARLRDWIARIARQPWSEAFTFFKHEDAGTGPRLALHFAELWRETNAATRGPRRAPARATSAGEGAQAPARASAAPRRRK